MHTFLHAEDTTTHNMRRNEKRAVDFQDSHHRRVIVIISSRTAHRIMIKAEQHKAQIAFLKVL
jgi:hypothetical protein